MIPVDLNAFGPDQNGWPRYVLRLVEQIESNKGKPIVPMLEAGPQGGKPEDHLRAAMKSAAHAEFPEIEKVLSKITVSPYLWRHIRGEDAWLQFRTEAAMSMPRPERHMSQIETIEHLRIYEDKQALWVPKLMKFFGHCGDRMWHNYGAKTQRDRRRPAFGNPRVSSPTKMRVRSLGRGGMSMGMRR